MPIKMPATDEAELNMTPMIDIVFNLVTFFMLTLDLSRKELAALDLPRAHEGVEDKDPTLTDEQQKLDNTKFTINLTKDGMIMLKGKEYPLSGPDVTPAQQQASLEKLRDQLRVLMADPRLREADGASKVMIRVRADRTTKWQYVQWVMQVCAEQKIFKIHFSVEHPPKK